MTIESGAWVTAGTSTEGQGGDLTVNARDSVELIGTSSVNGIPSSQDAGTKGAGAAGDLTINTGRLIVRDGAVVSAGTSSEGQGANLTVNALDSVELIGTSAKTVNSMDFNNVLGGALGKSVFELLEGHPVPSGLITGTGRTGAAGNLTINTGRLVVQDGAQASIFTTGAQDAGRLTVHASEVELSGTSKNDPSPNAIIGPSLLTTAVSRTANGNGGNLTIETGHLIVRDGAEVNVSSEGRGNAGSLTVSARDIFLNTQGKLRASTPFGEGGNINLRVGDLILMRRTSSISAEASNNAKGGNITSNAPFIITVPSENSDITANASRGQGGNINITTQGIFGTQYRQRQTGQSDITASSDFGVNGVVNINTPGIDPSRGLVNL